VPTPVDRQHVQELIAAGAQIVEVLPAAEYEEEHLPGAINLPLKQLNGDTVRRLDPSLPVVVYCFDAT
jgi:rhodanese-related sulfurtransferase